MKSLRYILMGLSLVMLASCNDQLRETGGFDPDADYAMELSVSCMNPQTKADPELWPGIEKYNENKVGRVDWYLFKSKTDTGEALAHGQVTATQEEGATTVKVVDALEMTQIMATAGTNTFYVYTIANLPESVEHEAMGTTLAALKAVELVAGFNNATFTAQDAFVMTGGNSVTLETKGLTPVTCDLTRVAAKVSINMNVTPAINQVTITPGGGREYVTTWYPKLDDVQVYLSFANQKTTVSANPVEYNSDGFFTYYRNAFVPGFSYTGDTADEPAADVPAPASVVPDWTDKDWRWNVTGSPFYSYPMTWGVDSPQAPFLKVILKWSSLPEKITGYDSEGKEIVEHANYGKNYAGEGETHEYYYKIPLPGNVLNSNDWYELTFNVAILGSTTDELPVELAGQYSVVNWSDPNVNAGGNLIQGRYLSTASDTYYMYGVDELEIPVTSSHVLATGSAVVTKREVLYNGQWVTTASGTSIPAQVSNLASRELDVTFPDGGDGRSAILFKDTLSPTINANLDLYPMRFTLQLNHQDGQGTPRTIMVYQYPSIYVSSKPGGNAMVDGYYGNVGGNYLCRTQGNTGPSGTWGGGYPDGQLRSGQSGTSQSSNSNDGHVPVPYGRIARYVNSQTDMVLLTISSFSESSKKYTISGNNREYIISDPREASGYTSNSLIAYYNGTSNQNWGDLASQVMVGSKANPANGAFIAPKILISSRWSRMVNSNASERTFEVMEKRCATYQEAGYPAGRWRLPTEAEVNFVANLQRLGFIQNLFTGDGWVSNGTAVSIGTNSVSLITNGTTARCVYDAWYWGEDPVLDDTTKYTIMVD